MTRIGSPKKVLCLILTVMLCLSGISQILAASVSNPVIKGEMPDCYLYMDDDPAVLYTDAYSPDGGTLSYQWYSTTINDISTIKAILGEEGETMVAPPTEDILYYCYAVWNTNAGATSDPVYSRLIRVEYVYAPVPMSMEILNLPDKTEYDPISFSGYLDLTGLHVKVYLQDGTVIDSWHGEGLEVNLGTASEETGFANVQVVYVNGLGYVEDHFSVHFQKHTHSFGEWMVTTQPTCTEEGIKARECDCGHTERAGVPAAGHKWDAGKVTKAPTETAEGVKTYTCTICQKTRTETIQALGASESSNTKKDDKERNQKNDQKEAQNSSDSSDSKDSADSESSVAATGPAGAKTNPSRTEAEKSSAALWWFLGAVAVVLIVMVCFVTLYFVKKKKKP